MKIKWEVCPECGYYNIKGLVDRFGTCKRCKKVLNQKAKYHYEMFKRLKLWRSK